ncbi:unnamed protein product [Closterium sp. NIES-53]
MPLWNVSSIPEFSNGTQASGLVPANDAISCASNSVDVAALSAPRLIPFPATPFFQSKRQRLDMDNSETKRQRVGTFPGDHRDAFWHAGRLRMPADVMAALDELTNSNPVARNDATVRGICAPVFSKIGKVGPTSPSQSQSSRVAGGPNTAFGNDVLCGIAPSDDFLSRNEASDLADLADLGELGDFDEETNRLLDVIWPECAARSNGERGEFDAANSDGGEMPNGGGETENVVGVSSKAIAGASEGHITLERQGSSAATISTSLEATRAPRADRQTGEESLRNSRQDTSSQVTVSVICAPIDPNQLEEIERVVRASSPGIAVAVPLIQPKLQTASSIPDTTAFSQMLAEFTKAAMAAPIAANTCVEHPRTMTVPSMTSALMLRQLKQLNSLSDSRKRWGSGFGGSPAEASSEATSRRWTSGTTAASPASQASPVSLSPAAMACDSVDLLAGRSLKELLLLVQESIRANEFALRQMGRD